MLHTHEDVLFPLDDAIHRVAGIEVQLCSRAESAAEAGIHSARWRSTHIDVGVGRRVTLQGTIHPQVLRQRLHL